MQNKFRTISLIAIFLGFVDAIGKYIALNRLSTKEVDLSSFFQFGLHKNLGIAFDIPLPLYIVVPLSMLVVVGLSIFIVRHYRTLPITSGFAVVALVGALGNLLDRVLHNFTTDYLIFFSRSAINISDILIVVGILVIVFYTESKERRYIS